MISRRNPMKDRIAIANAATTGFTPHNTDRSALSCATEACVAVLRDTGLRVRRRRHRRVNPANVLDTLGIPEVWHANVQIPFVNQVGTAMETIAAGLCEVVLRVPRTAPQCGVHCRRCVTRSAGGGVVGAGAAASRPPTRHHRQRGGLHRVGVAVPARVRHPRVAQAWR